jgi:hypothetical protein
MRAVEAGNLEATWRRYHDPNTKKTVADGKVVNELYGLLTDEQFERITGRKRKR